ncbi:MAG: aldo/keto reductase [Oscillospiraceae bacterium]|nr:aldo/keto reductase [Oscillospiraceae bacterium]
MLYRDYGNTRKISALGFGCMRLPMIEHNGSKIVDDEKAIPMLRRAVELGVNYFDTGEFYCEKQSEGAVGRALKPMREDVMISTKLPMWGLNSTGEFRRQLERSLQDIDTDYIDYYHFWALDREKLDKIFKYKLLAEAEKAKAEGLIRHISFSFHDEPIVIKEIIDRCEIMETMLVQYNLVDRSCEEMIAYAASRGVGVCAMGPVGGGKLAGNGRITYDTAMKFVLGNPNIACALAGMETMEMLEQNAAIAANPALSEAEWQQIGDNLEQLKRFSDLPCTNCGYCKDCPVNIDIPKIFGCYTNHDVYQLSAHAKKQWVEYRIKGGAALEDCIHCGLCEKKCPQKIAIREKLEYVESVLENI